MVNRHGDNSTRVRKWGDWIAAATRGLGHLVGTAVVAGVSLGLLTNDFARQSVAHGLGDGAYATSTTLRLGLHVALSAIAWWIVVAGWKLVRAGRSSDRTRSAPRGAVMLESAIVLPVALFLIMGLAQLGIVNIAETLSYFATYEAARSAWVWEGERDAGRMEASIGEPEVEEYARIQAALVLTPVAPGAFRQSWDLDDRAEKARAMLLAAQIPVPFDDSGNQMLAVSSTYRAMGVDPNDTTLSIALDTSSFMGRTARKFTWAYQATDVDYQEETGEVGVEVTYDHYCAFPLVGAAFGDQRTVAGREGFYREMNREVLREQELSAHGEWPEWQNDEIERSINYF